MESPDTVYEVRFTIGLFQSIFFYLYKIVVRVKPANVLDERSFSLARIVDYRNVFSKPAGQGRNFKASVICIGDKKKKEEEKKTSGRLAAISSFSVSRKQKDLSGNKRTDSPNTHI